MELKEIGKNRLVIEETNFLGWLIPLAIAGAGLMLVLGSIRHYGIQAWYRATYMGGGAMAFWGILYFLITPKSSKVKLDLEADSMTVEHKQGIRVLVKRYIFLPAIEQVRIEKKDPKKKNGNARPQYRLAAKVEGEWVILTHWAKSELYDQEEAARRIQAYVAESKKKLGA